MHLEPDVVYLRKGLKEKSDSAGEDGEVICLREAGDFDHHRSLGQGGANEVSLEACASIDKRGFGQGSHVGVVHMNVDKPTTADASWKVDQEGQVGGASELQEALDLDSKRAAGQGFFLVEIEAAGELPANSAGRELCSIRLGEGEILEGDQRRAKAICGQRDRRGAASCPDVSARDDWNQGVKIGLGELVVSWLTVMVSGLASDSVDCNACGSNKTGIALGSTRHGDEMDKNGNSEDGRVRRCRNVETKKWTCRCMQEEIERKGSRPMQQR